VNYGILKVNYNNKIKFYEKDSLLVRVSWPLSPWLFLFGFLCQKFRTFFLLFFRETSKINTNNLFTILRSLPIETNIWKGHKNKGEVSKNEAGISKIKGKCQKMKGVYQKCAFPPGKNNSIY
jgi:hypothetical protein